MGAGLEAFKEADTFSESWQLVEGFSPIECDSPTVGYCGDG